MGRSWIRLKYDISSRNFVTMADFDKFESNAPAEEDPAADFFAREQDQMACLEIDTFSKAEPAGTSNPFGDSEADLISDDVTSDPAPAVTESTGDFFQPIPQEEPTSESIAQESPCSATSASEPEKIRVWREEQEAMLTEKDAGDEKKKEEWREAARNELQEWYRHSAEQFEKAKVNNRDAERAVVQERGENIPGHEWERICRLCEFNPKQSSCKKDVNRQRSILLQLRQTPLIR